jgi:uroporphyrinogen-III synthase
MDISPAFAAPALIRTTGIALPRPALSPPSPRRPRCRQSGCHFLFTMSGVIRVALTRETGKNSLLRDAMTVFTDTAACVELPCVETVVGPDHPALPGTLTSRTWSWVVITSPEAASVFRDAWRAVGKPELRVAAVGEATAQVLVSAGINVEFVPAMATGIALVREMNDASADGEAILYPASALASAAVPDGLVNKGYEVVRLNTYSTCVAKWDAEDVARSEDVDVVTFAAPSAVRGWALNAGISTRLFVACIGETSHAAAVKAGFPEANVFYPVKPGMDGWVSAVGAAIAAAAL